MSCFIPTMQYQSTYWLWWSWKIPICFPPCFCTTLSAGLLYTVRARDQYLSNLFRSSHFIFWRSSESWGHRTTAWARPRSLSSLPTFASRSSPHHTPSRYSLLTARLHWCLLQYRRASCSSCSHLSCRLAMAHLCSDRQTTNPDDNAEAGPSWQSTLVWKTCMNPVRVYPRMRQDCIHFCCFACSGSWRWLWRHTCFKECSEGLGPWW